MATPNHEQNRDEFFQGLLDSIGDGDNYVEYREQLQDFLDTEGLDLPHLRHDRARILSREEVVRNQLESVILAEIGSDDRACDICYINFGVSADGSVPAEEAVRLPCCRKIIGKACVEHWFEIQNTCPNCRKKLFRIAVDARSFQAAYREGQIRRRVELRERLDSEDEVWEQEQLRLIQEREQDINQRRAALYMERRRLFSELEASGRIPPSPARIMARNQSGAPFSSTDSSYYAPPRNNTPQVPMHGHGPFVTPSIYGGRNEDLRLGPGANLHRGSEIHSGMPQHPLRQESESALSPFTVHPPPFNPPPNRNQRPTGFHGRPGNQASSGHDNSSSGLPILTNPNYPPSFPMPGPSRGHMRGGASRIRPGMTLPPTPAPSFVEPHYVQFGSQALQPPPWQPQMSLSESAQRGVRTHGFNQHGLLDPHRSAQMQPPNPDSRTTRRNGISMFEVSGPDATGESVQPQQHQTLGSNPQFSQNIASLPLPSGDSSRTNDVGNSRAGGTTLQNDYELL